MKRQGDMFKTFLLLLLLLSFNGAYSQDSLQARMIDSLLKRHSNRVDSRRDISGDTITFYMYQPKTSNFLQVIEYWNIPKNKTSYVYHYNNGELKRITVWKRNGMYKRDPYVSFYFAQNNMIHKERQGLDYDDIAFLLSRGNVFLARAPAR